MCFTFLFFTILFMKTIGCYHNLWAHISVAQDQVESNNFFSCKFEGCPRFAERSKNSLEKDGSFSIPQKQIHLPASLQKSCCGCWAGGSRTAAESTTTASAVVWGVGEKAGRRPGKWWGKKGSDGVEGTKRKRKRERMRRQKLRESIMRCGGRKIERDGMGAERKKKWQTWKGESKDGTEKE